MELLSDGLRLEVISILCSASSAILQPAEALQELQSPGVYLHVLQRCCCMRTAEDVTLNISICRHARLCSAWAGLARLGMVFTSASNEGYPKVRNHGEGPY